MCHRGSEIPGDAEPFPPPRLRSGLFRIRGMSTAALIVCMLFVAAAHAVPQQKEAVKKEDEKRCGRTSAMHIRFAEIEKGHRKGGVKKHGRNAS